MICCCILDACPEHRWNELQGILCQGIEVCQIHVLILHRMRMAFMFRGLQVYLGFDLHLASECIHVGWLVKASTP